MKNYLLIFLTLLSSLSFGQAINLDPSDTIDYVSGTAINLDLRYTAAAVTPDTINRCSLFYIKFTKK